MDQHLFQTIFAGYNDGLMEGVELAIAAGLGAMATIVQILGMMFVAVFGYLTFTGNMAPKARLSMICRILLVQAAMTPLYFNRYIRDVMLDWLPNWIAAAVGTGTGDDGGVAQFDQLRVAIVHMADGLRMQATGFSYIAERIEIWLLELFCMIVLELSFFMWVFVRGLLALIVSIGPFVIVSYLFNATRTFAENWIGKLGGVGILLLLISVLLKIIVVQFQNFIGRIDTAAGGVEAGMEAMMGVLIAMGFGVGLLLYLPRLAFTIGTGAAFDIANGAVMGATAMTSTARAAGRAAAAGARVGARAAVGTALAGRAAGRLVQRKFWP